jgi:predicted kinase
MSKPVLIAMMGLPRSGKSTISRELAKRLGAPIVNRDAIRLALHGQRYEAAAEPMVKAMSLYMIRALFGAGHNVVICDETNYSRAARKSLEDPNWDIEWYPVLTNRIVCRARALLTQQDDLLPVIDEMFKRYEPLERGSRLHASWQPGEFDHDALEWARNTSS